ncbi:unnamed protein product [Candidula unifasciata]|uniref:Vezatin n=1 Tax=Candidula unifasciata TaxID=100452 RepID=A0A8S3ZNK7_9EUPU|nr:unnamed protein product [Candidula unifasciata]
MESEDEDLIFENSVLHQALMDIGVCNLQTEPRLQLEADSFKGPELSRETNRLSSVTETNKSCKLHSNLFNRLFYTEKVIEEVHNYHRYDMLKWLISSQLLSEEDQMFLQSYVDEKAPTRDAAKCLSSYTFHLMIASLILVNVLCPTDLLSSWWMLLLGCMPQVSGLYTYTHVFTPILVNIIWVLCVAVPLLFLKKRTCQQILSQMEKQDKAIKDVVMASVELLQLERKCLRLVKESELVARGFTIASQHYVASHSSQMNASSSLDQLCPALREVMFSQNMLITQEIKKSVGKMLRGSVGLLSVYLSGLVRRLALCFCPENLRDKTVNPYEATRECTEMSGKAVKSATTLLKQSYKFYRAFHKSDETTAPRKVQRSRLLGQSQIYNLYVCVNSLDLHLQSLLQLTRNLAIKLEDRVDKEQQRLAGEDEGTGIEIRSISEEDKAVWEDTLKRIKSSLESCKGCYEESVKHLCQKADTDRTTNGFVKEANRDVTQSSQTKVVVVPAEDPVIVDQVFEATVDTDEEEEYPAPRRLYSTEQKVKHQEDKEAIKRFRQELQTVVGHRAVFHKAREERALARARGEVIPDEEEIHAQPFDGVQVKSREIMKQNEDGFATEEGQQVCAVDTQKQQIENNLRLATEGDSKSSNGTQPTEKDLGVFSPVQIDKKTQNRTFDTLEKESQSSGNEIEHHKDSSSGYCKQPCSYHSSGFSDQCFSNTSNHDMDSKTQSDLSQRKYITSVSSRTEFVSHEGENSQRITDVSLPSALHSLNFTKNIAMMAASQARTLTSSYLEEEQFGDNSSDSDVTQDEQCDS